MTNTFNIKDEVNAILEKRASVIGELNAAAQKLHDTEDDADAQNLVQQKRLTWSRIVESIEYHKTVEGVNKLALSTWLYDAKAMFSLLETADTGEWGYDFMKFACKLTGRDARTIDNYIRVARIYVADAEALGVPKGIEFDPWKVNFSSLLLVAHKVEAGTLTDKCWQLMSDPATEYKTLVAAVANSTPDKKKKIFAFLVEDDVVYFRDPETKEQVGIAAIEHDESNPSVERGISLLKAKLAQVEVE